MFNRIDGELEAREQSQGLRMVDLLTMPEPLANLINWMMRKKQVCLAEIAGFLKKDEAAAQASLADALKQGYLREFSLRGVTYYRVRIAPKRVKEHISNIWDALDDKVADEERKP